MNDKLTMLSKLQMVFDRWEELLASLGEEKTLAPLSPSGWSIKDVIAHLMAWQQVSIERLEAAELAREPVLPAWLGGLDPESEEDTDWLNARI